MIEINKNLSGKVAVITGGGGILCAAIAKELSRHGVKSAILDLNEERANAVANEINSAGGEAVGVACNVLDTESMNAAKEKVVKRFGGYDILINGAGGNNPRACTSKDSYSLGDENNSDVVSFFDLTKEGFSFVFDLNFIGTFIPTQVFARDMIGKEGTTILNISSMSSFSPLTRVPAYSAAKAGVSNFTQWLAVHFADVGIRVNAIAPGFFLTEQNRALLTNTDGSLTPRSEKVMAKTPMKRFGVPEDLFGSVIFLLDENMSGFINGTVLPIDGGFMAYSGV